MKQINWMKYGLVCAIVDSITKSLLWSVCSLMWMMNFCSFVYLLFAEIRVVDASRIIYNDLALSACPSSRDLYLAGLFCCII